MPATPRGEPCESVISAQPTSPSSVVTLTKIHGRQPASQNSVSSAAMRTCGGYGGSPTADGRPREPGVAWGAMPPRSVRELSTGRYAALCVAVAALAVAGVVFAGSPLPRLTPDSASYLTGAERLAHEGRPRTAPGLSCSSRPGSRRRWHRSSPSAWT